MDTVNWTSVIAGIAVVVTVINLIYSYYNQRQRATREDVDAHALAIATMKAQLANLPDQNAFHKLDLAVMEIRGEQRVLAAETKPIGVSVKRIEEFLLNQHPTGRTRK